MLTGANVPDRLKRISMRSWRRGTKEMDLILGPYADARLTGLDGPALDAFESLLEETDADLYPWIVGARPAPEQHGPTIEALRSFHEIA